MKNIKLVPMRCTQCNATVEIDIHNETAVCDNCGTPFILEGEKDDGSYANLLRKAESHLDLWHYDTARKVFEEMADKYPDKYRGWWGLVEAKTKGFTAFDVRDVQIDYERAHKKANDAEKAKIAAVFEEYKSRQAEFGLKREQDAAAKAVVDGKIGDLTRRINLKNQKIEMARRRKYPWKGMFILIGLMTVAAPFFMDIAPEILIEVAQVDTFLHDMAVWGLTVDIVLIESLILGAVIWIGLGILFSIVKLIVWCKRKLFIRRLRAKLNKIR